MIVKYTSQGLNDILDESLHKLDDINDTVTLIKKDLEKKLTIINNEHEYSLKRIEELSEQIENQDGINNVNNRLILTEKILSGVYEKFGACIHPKFSKTPYNVFNLLSTSGYIFKTDVEVLINNSYNEEYLSLLKHSSILGQDPFFYEFSDHKVSIEVAIKKNIVGSTKFNVLEIDPFLSGSFVIDSIELYSLDDYNLGISKAETTLTNIAGIPQRLILNDAIQLHKAIFNITIIHKNKANKYPLGFKNIYFLNTSFDESFVVTTLHQPRYIRQINQGIVIRDQKGRRTTALSSEGIKLYSECNDGKLEYEISLEADILNNTFPKNIKDAFVYIPVKNPINYIDFLSIVLDEK